MTSIEELKQNNPKTLYIAYLKAILCALFWGGTFIAGKIAAPYASPFAVGFTRFAIASIFLVIVLESQHNSLRNYKLNRKQILGVTCLGLTGIFAYNIFFLLGLNLIPASRASLIIANNPLAIALGAAIFLGEKLKPLQYMGILISAIGSMTITSNGNILSLFTEISSGDLAIFMCVLSWASYSIIGKFVLNSLSPIIAVTWACIIGALFFLPFALKDLISVIPSLPLEFWLSALYLGIFGTALGFVWFYQVMTLIGATRTGIFTSFVPAFGVSLSVLLLNEPLTTSVLIGGALILTGVYIVNRG